MILCCGEALIDMIPMPTESGVDGFAPHTSGSIQCNNSAWAIGTKDREFKPAEQRAPVQFCRWDKGHSTC